MFAFIQKVIFFLSLNIISGAFVIGGILFVLADKPFWALAYLIGSYATRRTVTVRVYKIQNEE